MSKIVKILALFIVSIFLGFIPTYLIAENNSSIASSSIPFFMWGLFTIIITVALNNLTNRGGTSEKHSDWDKPEEIRDRVITAPQFVGRFDKENGYLESTARMINNEYVAKDKWFRQDPVNYTVCRFRGELLDRDGVPLENVPVEITAESSKWIGNIVEGDRIRVEGKYESDGILHSKNAFNYSTNSWVGEKRTK